MINIPTVPCWVISKFNTGLLIIDCFPWKPIKIIVKDVETPSVIDPIELTKPLVCLLVHIECQPLHGPHHKAYMLMQTK